MATLNDGLSELLCLAYGEPAEAKLLLAIASESLVSSPLSQQFISTHHLPATSSVKTALKALVDKLLVSKTPNGYLVSDRFFAKWLVRGGITL